MRLWPWIRPRSVASTMHTAREWAEGVGIMSVYICIFYVYSIYICMHAEVGRWSYIYIYTYIRMYVHRNMGMPAIFSFALGTLHTCRLFFATKIDSNEI